MAGLPDRSSLTAGKLLLALAMVAALGGVLSWLQGRFDSSDARKGIALAMGHRPQPGGPTIFEALVARREGDPRCDGEVLSTLFGDVRVRCATPARPEIEYDFRVLLDGKRPPRAENGPAQALLGGLGPPARP
jgi:hypothetical protein